MNPLTRLLSFFAPQEPLPESPKKQHERQLQQPTPAPTASIGAQTHSTRLSSRREESGNKIATSDSVQMTPSPWVKVSSWQQTFSSYWPESVSERTAEPQRGRKRILTPGSDQTRARKRRAPQPHDDDVFMADVPIPSVEESPVRSSRLANRQRGRKKQKLWSKKTSQTTCDEYNALPEEDFSREGSLASDTLPTEITPSEHSHEVVSFTKKDDQYVENNKVSGVAKELQRTPNHKRPRRDVTPPSPDQIKVLRATREAEAAALADQGWSPPDVALFRKLQLRGLEPLLPMYMAHDFAFLPAALFTTEEDEAYIQPSGLAGSHSLTGFHHLRALQGLLQCGNRIRPCAKSAASEPSTWRGGEHWMTFAVENYRRWALADLGFSRAAIKQGIVPRNLTLVELPTRLQLNAAEMNHRTLAALLKLEADWHMGSETTDRQPPPFYALVMTGTMTAIVSLTDSQTQDRLRPVASFDWDDAAMDVWNAFAAAILMVHTRDLLASALGLRQQDSQIAASICKQAAAYEREHDPDA